MKQIMFKITEPTHKRLKSLQAYAKRQGIQVTMKSIMEEAVNCMPTKWFKKVKGEK